MNLYEISDEIENCIDKETGEVLDIEALNALKLTRSEKIESVACWYKNLMADAEALKTEKDAFAKREKTARNKAESLKRYLSGVLNGEKFTTDKCALTFRRSESVEVNMDYFLTDGKHNSYVDYNPQVNKTELKKALKNGETFEGASLKTSYNIQIK